MIVRRTWAGILLAILCIVGGSEAAAGGATRGNAVITPGTSPENSPVLVQTTGAQGGLILAARDWSTWDPDGFKASWIETFYYRPDLHKWLYQTLAKPDVTMNSQQASMVADTQGNVYLAAYVFSEIHGPTIQVWHATGTARHWDAPVTAWRVGGGYSPNLDVQVAVGLPSGKRAAPVYLIWSGWGAKGTVILGSISTDMGKTWTPQTVLVQGTKAVAVSDARPLVGKDGTLHVFYHYGPAMQDASRAPSELRAGSAAAHGGIGMVSLPAGTLHNPVDSRPKALVATRPVVASISALADKGTFTVAWTESDGHTKDGNTIRYSQTSDSGKTWSVPRTIAVSGAMKNAWYDVPTLAASGTRVGLLFTTSVKWRAKGQSTYNVYLAQSTNAGKTFGAPKQLSTKPSDPMNEGLWGKGNAITGCYMGLVLDAKGWWAAWTDITTPNEVIQVQSGT